jgi:hypothetical protein
MKGELLLKRNSTLAVIALSVVVLGFLDYVTAYKLGFYLFYFLPIAIAGWKVGSAGPYLISILSATLWFLSSISSHPYSSGLAAFWTTIMRLLSFLVMAYLTSKIHFLLVKERETARDRLCQVKTLSGFIPICASCNKIRDDKGYWQRIEEYVEERTNAQFTHGLCQECVDKLLKDARIEYSPEQAGSLVDPVSSPTLPARRSFRGRSPRVGFK